MEFVKKNRNQLLMVVGLLLVVATGITFAYYSVGDKQTVANTFNSGCLSVNIESETDALSLNGAYPISDVEGLDSTPYTFTIKNNCSESANYQINLESLNEASNSLNADYIRVALSSDTMSNLVSTLSSNEAVTPSISGSYASHKLYSGTIAGNASKTFNLREWIDYDATIEQAANKTYTSKINVIANPKIEVENNPEVLLNVDGNVVKGVITGNASSASYCTTDGDKICTPSTNTTISSNEISINKPSKIKKETVATVLGNIDVNTGADVMACVKLNNNKTYCSDAIKTTINSSFSKIATTNEGIFKAQDDDGTSYYYRGAVTNNYLTFAGKRWRIIRINGDGTIRIIYDGTAYHANGTSTSDSIAVTSTKFNSTYNNAVYVGFKYGTTSEARGLTNKSTILTALETWYSNNLASYEDYIDTNAGFCGDRTSYTNTSGTTAGTGYGTSTQYFADYVRLITNKAPVLTCANTNDLYTVSGASKGNKSLTYPIGLINANEVSMAGGVYNTNNTSYYLYNGQYYWTMSPSYYDSYAGVFIVHSYGNLAGNINVVNATPGVRPVINLRADVTITGSGTQKDPYRLGFTIEETPMD